MAARLAEFIAETGGLPFVWGVRDCTIWVADWCVERFGFDPACSLRGAYCSERGALALTGRDLVSFVGPYLDRLSIKKKGDPGDVGIIAFRGRQMSAISTGPFWAIKTKQSVALLRADPLIVWGL